MTDHKPLRLEPVLFGAQLADPKDHPRWDGERIRPYDEHPVMWDEDNGWEDDQA